MKSFYSDYVAHCLRFYVRNPGQPSGISLSDLRNWEAASRAMNSLTNSEREIVEKVYESGENVNDSLRAISCSTGKSTDELWRLVKATEKRVADERGLI